VFPHGLLAFCFCLPEIAPKYRNPENHSETWSGRGREPKWLQHQIASGKTKEDF
jgi:DNA-binding protein H-NS